MKLFTFHTLEEASQALAQRICTAARKSIAGRGRFSLVLSGGSSPRRLYQLLAEPPFTDQLDWQHIHFFWGDERCVAPDHPDSNFRMVKESLLDHITIPMANIHRMPGEMVPEEGAQSYQSDLKEFFKPEAAIFDFILLGLGSDGHTASLFPDTAGLQERQRDVINAPAPRTMVPKIPRLTLSLPAINRAREICFLAGLKGKKDILENIRRATECPYPAAMVVGADWYVAG